MAKLKIEFTPAFVPVANVLRGAKRADLKDIVILGYDEEGRPHFAASSSYEVTKDLVNKFRKLILAEGR